MDNVVQVHPKEVLLSLDAIYGLSARLSELPFSRRETLNWLADTLHRWIEQGGKVLDGEGREIDLYPGIIDDAHGEDGSAVWISEQRKRLGNPPRRKPCESMLLRLQLYDAAFRIAFGTSIIIEEAEASDDDMPF